MTISRRWAYRNDDHGRTCCEDGTCEHCEVIEARLDQVAQEWSRIMTEIENENFDREGYEDYLAEVDADEGAEGVARVEADMRKQRLTRRVRLEFLEAELAHHGARMMRPYEHWNEEEQLMAWLEGGR